MGRAIDMENDIQKMKVQVDRIDAALAKVIDVVDSMQEKGQRTTHVDLVDDDWDPNEIGEEATKMMKEGADKHVKEKEKSKKSNEKAKRPKKD